ncbi:TetR/AcrR family transcriptional regulator [Streptomyces sp. NPDC029004]|uniref:TetR/AcrR family transcriptional regulator n=1 Tax=Streptomyces sp. NPDC029004 TaxID=3154490 RepID=UPI003408C2B4
MTAKTLRERVRAEITEEIRAVARRHLATEGANLSLRAVARDTGLVPSALYRYFAGRDALLTALITDAYEVLADAVEAAEAAVPRADVAGRWLAVCRAVRAWALDNPAEYALIYGSPVPGYAAPEDTVGPASRVLLTLSGILFDSAEAGQHAVGRARPLPTAVREDLARLMNQWPGELPQGKGPSSPEALLAMALTLWTHLFGLVSFEVFGRLNNMIDAREEYFDHQVRIVADLAGLAAPHGADGGA